jgi:uncharacterized protein (UPF0218 family)
MPPADTRSASSEEIVWVVPDALRRTLAERYGPVLAGEEADRKIRSLELFGACGDRVTARSLELGHPPLVGIVDLKTQRHEPIDPGVFAPLAAVRKLHVRNPAGTLTGRLRGAVRELVHGGGGLVEVDGEEDLGALALVEELPAGATVIYGIPGAGVSFVAVDAAAKERVRAIIAQMERRRTQHGTQDP